MRAVIRLAWLAPLLALAACAPLAPQATATPWACEGGKGFRLISAGTATAIEINGMHFELEAAPGGAGETVYRCSMLEVSLREGSARVAMEGRPYLAGCRVVP